MAFLISSSFCFLRSSGFSRLSLAKAWNTPHIVVGKRNIKTLMNVVSRWDVVGSGISGSSSVGPPMTEKNPLIQKTTNRHIAYPLSFSGHRAGVSECLRELLTVKFAAQYPATIMSAKKYNVAIRQKMEDRWIDFNLVLFRHPLGGLF